MASPPDRPSVAQRLAMYVDPGAGVPVHRQIVDRLWQEVVSGSIETGTRLPTVRELAVELGVRPDVIANAYAELEQLGVVVTRPGEGSVVGLRSPDTSALERRRQLERICRDVLEQASALGIPLDELIVALAAWDRSAQERDERRDAP